MLPLQLLIGLHLYEAVTVPAYLRLVYVLLNNKKFRAPFWRIFSIVAILDLLYYGLTLLFYRLPLLPLFNGFYASLPPSRWIGWAMCLAFWIVYQQNFLNILICLNRFSGICFPFNHSKFWRRTLGGWLIGSFALSFALTFNRLFTVGQFQPLIANDSSQGLTPIPVEFDIYFTRQELITAVLGTLCALICVFFNSVTLFLIIRHRNQQCKQQQQMIRTKSTNGIAEPNGGRRLEIGLFLITLWTMLVQLVFNACEVLLIYLIIDGFYPSDFFAQNKAQSLALLFAQIPWVVDIYVLSAPWAAMALSSELRAAAFPKLFKAKPQSMVLFSSAAVAPLKFRNNS